MSWLLIIILAYFFLALSSLGDKLFLKGKEKPENYVFYVGALSGLVVFLIPFINNFTIPSLEIIFLAFLEGVIYIIALYALYYALDRFEVSVVVPSMGGLQPIFIFFLSLVFFQLKVFDFKNILALALLIIGTFLISINKKEKGINKKALLFSGVGAVFFALDFILTKQVFLTQPFLQGLVFMRIFSFLTVMIFLLNKRFRKGIFRKKEKKINKRMLFFGTQVSGGIGIFLQSYAISLVPVVFLATLNALKGVQYVFLIFLTFIISTFYSKFLKEDFEKKVFIRKIVSVIVISLGIALLVI